MIGWLNVGSLVLGLIAWILPMVNLMWDKKQENKNWVFFVFMSLSACAISLCFHILYTYHKVAVEDWSALMDTMYALAFASTVLLIVTILLNVITLNVYRDRIAK
ncbi:hypothetical protein [Salipaludibacillus daqingensis]|uniref:hypothetical protein n=1 Tax=Salipaludibacillus daqingensis TaxID=3041001 RepID=UPI002472FF14|nr:hypothetical protein [Salipaludibacillus daqingensis]